MDIVQFPFKSLFSSSKRSYIYFWTENNKEKQ